MNPMLLAPPADFSVYGLGMGWARLPGYWS
ncbi:hypothetical protein CO731_03139 [Aminobacter sp. MSH1]|nr:hypothetical protein CO731_03139 [Aminobacter sp. MSH1]